MMKQKLLLMMSLLALLAFSIQPVSGNVNVWQVRISPDGPLVGNQTPVEATVLVDIISEGERTFSRDNTLQLSTDLEDAVWTPVLSRNRNMETLPVKSGKSIAFSSWELSYPSSHNTLALKVTLTGFAPRGASTENRTIVHVAEHGPNSIIKSSEVIERRMVTYIANATRPEPAPVPVRGTSIAVSSGPSGAAVSLDGSDSGTTPCTLTNLTAGRHVIVLSAAGYTPARMEVTAIEGVTIEVASTLSAERVNSAAATPEPTIVVQAGPAPVRRPATLVIDSIPPWARISIDGQVRGTSPVTLTDLEPGTYRVEMSYPFFASCQTDVNLAAGENRSLFGTLMFSPFGQSPVMSLISGFRPGIPLPGNDDMESPSKESDRQKAYEELVKSMGEE